MANKLIQAVYDLKDLATAKLTAIGNALRGNAKTADTAAGQMEKANKRASESFKEAADRVGLFNAGLLKIAGAASAAAAAIAGFAGIKALFTDSVTEAANLEDALTQVRAVTGATADQMARMKAAAEKASETTRFSTIQAVGALGDLARASGDADAAIAQLPATLNLAGAAQISASKAAEILSTTLVQFGLKAGDAAKVADIMAREANSTSDSVEGLGLALSYAAPQARALGLTLDQTAAIMGAMANQGFRGERAGTALRAVFSQLQDPASKFSQSLIGLGIESTDFVQVIQQLAAAGDRGREAILSLDAESRPAILALVNDGGRGILQLIEDFKKASGEAQRTSDAMSKTFNAATDRLKNAFLKLREDFVAPILAPVADQFDALAKRMRAFADSGAFAAIKKALVDFTATAIANITAFVQSVDFTAVARKLSDFATSAQQTFQAIAGSGQFLVGVFNLVSGAIGAAVAGIKVPLYALATAVSGALDGVARSFNSMLQILPGVPDVAREAAKKTVAELDKLTADFAGKTKQATLDAVGSTAAMAKALAGLAAPAQTASTNVANLTTATGQLTEAQKAAALTALQLTQDALAKLPPALQALVAPFADTVKSLQQHTQAVAAAGGASTDLADKTKSSAEQIAAAEQRFAAATVALHDLTASGIEPASDAMEKARAEFFAARGELEKLRKTSTDTAASQDLLKKSFEALHITSTQELQNTAKAYEASLARIVAAARTGAASQDDVRRAFIATAQAQIEAAGVTDQATRAAVEAQIRQQAAALNVVDALKDLGLAGQDAGDAVADGADRAAQALGNLADSADAATESAHHLADSSDAAAGSLANVSGTADSTAAALGNVSAAFLDAAASGGQLDRIEFGKLQAQQQDAENYLAQLNDQIAKTDELSQRVAALKQQYTLLGDDQLRVIAEKEKQLEENNKRQQQDLQSQRDTLAKDKAATATTTTGGSGAIDLSKPIEFRHVVEFKNTPPGISETQLRAAVLQVFDEQDVKESMAAGFISVMHQQRLRTGLF